MESSGELGEIPVPAGQGHDFEAQGTEGWTLPNKKGSAVPAAVEDYNGRDILNAKTVCALRDAVVFYGVASLLEREMPVYSLL